jgi:lipoprotein-anchoring transpeptidase ErfK/SrfK
VWLPTRPNGSTGWVKATDVRMARITQSITVNLSAKTITVSLPGQAPVTAPAGIGTEADPTPKGRFYVTDRVKPADAHGAYGPLALGLSAHSDVLKTFGAGDGQIGIHGTNEPASIGKAASHGCIRVPAPIVTLLQRIPLGTPVTIG